MKRFDIPPVLTYIILIACLGVLAFVFPRTSYILGSIYQYGIYILLAFIAVVIVIYNILGDKQW